MNEAEFKKCWELERHSYEAWGKFVVKKIEAEIRSEVNNFESFFKVAPNYRLKDIDSLIDKAFYRPNKNYDDPYNQIEDKVGVRFVVLLLTGIEKICRVIEHAEDWNYDACKHFDEERKKDPLLFTYQSVHYVLRPRKDMRVDGVTVPMSTPCEVQIRTLLQHAHAELTHDAIYKSKKVVQPDVHRTVAKSMALIETTDDFFVSVTDKLNSGPIERYTIVDRFDSLYVSATGLKPHNTKLSLVIWDQFEQFVDEGLPDVVSKILNENPFLCDIVREKYVSNIIYRQSVVFFVYWLLLRRKRRLLEDWPLPIDILQPLANDVGVSLHGS